ncbi:MAG: carboxypeptidase regulatory-like domain-containing protein [Planctomycetes bacterium]|nr:carboxypeptidase regulatory-like domain-containing protein [Planctomycetota bacterium]
MARSDRAALLLAAAFAACQGDGSDIGPRLPPLPPGNCKAVVLDDAGRGVVAARVAVAGATAFTGPNGRGDLFADPRGRFVVEVDGTHAAAVAGDELGRLRLAATIAGPDLPAPIHLPAFAPGSITVLDLGTQAAATTVASPAGGSLTVPAGSSVGTEDAAATTVRLRVGDLQPRHLPGDLPPAAAGALLCGRAFCVDPPDITFTPAADLDLEDDLGLDAVATAALYRLLPDTGEWVLVRTGLAAASGRVAAPGALAGGGIYVLGADVPATTVSGRVVLPAGDVVPGAMVAIGGRRTVTDGTGRFALDGVPAVRADGSPYTAGYEVFAGGDWLPARVAGSVPVGAAPVDLGDLVLDTSLGGNVRVQQVLRARAEVLQPARLSAVNHPVAIVTLGDELGRATFEDLPALEFGYEEGRPLNAADVNYGQGVAFLDRGRRWLDFYQFLQRRPWFIGQRQSRVYLCDAAGGGPLRNAAFVIGATPGQGLVGRTDQTGTFFVDRAVDGRATGVLLSQRDGRTLVHAFSIAEPNGDHLELPLQRLLVARLGAFDRHGLVAGALLGADPGREHRLRATRRLDLQEWWDDVVDGVPLASSLPIDVDPAVTHAAFQAGVALPAGHLAACELTAPGGVTTLQKLGLLLDFVPQQGAAVARDIDLAFPATTTFLAGGVLVGADPLVDVSQLTLDLGLLQPSGRPVDVVRGLRGNHAAAGDDLEFTLPALDGPLADHRWLALLQGSFASGGATLRLQSLQVLPAAPPQVLPPFPVVTAPAPGATVPAAGFTVEFALPAGALYGTIELRSDDGGDTRLWQALVRPAATGFAFVAMPTDVPTPLIAGRNYELTVSACFGPSVLAGSEDPYRDLSAFARSIGAAERGVRQVTRRTLAITTN